MKMKKSTEPSISISLQMVGGKTRRSKPKMEAPVLSSCGISRLPVFWRGALSAGLVINRILTFDHEILLCGGILDVLYGQKNSNPSKILLKIKH